VAGTNTTNLSIPNVWKNKYCLKIKHGIFGIRKGCLFIERADFKLNGPSKASNTINGICYYFIFETLGNLKTPKVFFKPIGSNIPVTQ